MVSMNAGIKPIQNGTNVSCVFTFQVDFANRESQLAFYHSMEKTGQDIRDFYEMLAERRQVYCHVSISALCWPFHSRSFEKQLCIAELIT